MHGLMGYLPILVGAISCFDGRHRSGLLGVPYEQRYTPPYANSIYGTIDMPLLVRQWGGILVGTAIKQL